MTEYESNEETDVWTDSFVTDEQPQQSGGRHPLNITHLVMGIAFLSFVGVWALIVSDLVRLDDLRWLLPVPWVLAGLGGLLATAFRGRPSTSG